MGTASYTKTPQGDGFIFHVTPAPKANAGCMGMFQYILLAGLCAMLVGGFLMSSGNPIMVTFGLIVGIIVFIFIYRWGLKGKSKEEIDRQPTSFTVYPHAIEMSGQKMNKEDIHRLIIRNAYDDPTLIIDYNNPGQRAALARREMHAQVNYVLTLESGGRASALAGGLDEITANGLLTDVSRILGFN